MVEHLKWHLITILLGLTHSLSAEMALNVSESTSTAPANMSSSNMETTSNQDLREMKNENLTDNDSTFNKYRRNGIEMDYVDRWEDEHKNYMEMPNQRNQYEDEFYPYHRERARFNEKIHHVRVQGCPHYSRDVSRDDGVTRSGILQGWLGAARTGTRNNDDKRFDTSPFYMTTAVAKTATSYRNPAISNNKQQGEYDNNYDKQSANYLSSTPKYTGNYNKVKGSASKDYYNFQGGNYVDDRNVNPWQSPQQNKNNRVVYYEYNLDDNNRMRPNFVYYPQNNNQYSAPNYDQCEPEYDENYRKPVRNQNNIMYNKNRYPTTSIYGGSFLPQSRLSTSFNQESNERQYPPYNAADETYVSRNADRGDARNSGYDFHLPYTGTPNERMQFPAVPSTYMPQSHFISESVPERQEKSDVKPISYGGHRFNFQTN